MRSSHIVALGSIIFSATSSLKAPENWLCFGSSCYWITDDVEKVKNDGNTITSCRYDQPELSIMTSLFLSTDVSSLCGCQYCSFTFPTVQPTVQPIWTSEIVAPTDTADMSWMTFDEKDNKLRDSSDDILYIMNVLLNQIDFSFFAGTNRNYSIVFCSKPFDRLTAPATCKPVVICNTDVLCQEKEIIKQASVVQDSASKASKDLKSLWGLLFLPGFLVGLCAAYCFYRQRNRLKQKAEGQIIEPQYDTNVTSLQNQPVLQNMNHSPNLNYVQQGHLHQQNQSVQHAVNDPQMTNVGESMHNDKGLAVMNRAPQPNQL